jgi:hypothetical protein
MQNPLQELVGLCVTDAFIIHDYIQIIFGRSASLTVNNDYALNGIGDITQLKNFPLLSAFEDGRQVILRFDNDISISIALTPEAYHGPEAIVLNREGEAIVVWN